MSARVYLEEPDLVRLRSADSGPSPPYMPPRSRLPQSTRAFPLDLLEPKSTRALILEDREDCKVARFAHPLTASLSYRSAASLRFARSSLPSRCLIYLMLILKILESYQSRQAHQALFRELR